MWRGVSPTKENGEKSRDVGKSPSEKGRRERKKTEKAGRKKKELTPDVGDRSVATSRHQQATQRRRARLAGGVQHGVSIFVHGVELVVTPRHVEGERDGAVVAGPGGLQRSAETRKKAAGEEGRASAGKDRRERERRKKRRTKKRKGYAYLQRSSFSSGPHPAPTVVQRSRRQPFLHVARRIPKSKVRVESVEEMTGVAESRLLSVHAEGSGKIETRRRRAASLPPFFPEKEADAVSFPHHPSG